MMDLVAHYRAVRARIVNAPPRPSPPLAPQSQPLPPPAPSAPQPPRLFDGARLSARQREAVLPILRETGFAWLDLWNDSRAARYHHPRRLVWHALAQLGLSLPQIGRLTHRDHTTVLHGLRKLYGIERENTAGARRDTRSVRRRCRNSAGVEELLRHAGELDSAVAGPAREPRPDRDKAGADPERRS